MLSPEFLEQAGRASRYSLLNFARVTVADKIEELCLEDKLTEKDFNDTVRKVMVLLQRVAESGAEVELLRK